MAIKHLKKFSLFFSIISSKQVERLTHYPLGCMPKFKKTSFYEILPLDDAHKIILVVFTYRYLFLANFNRMARNTF